LTFRSKIQPVIQGPDLQNILQSPYDKFCLYV